MIDMMLNSRALRHGASLYVEPFNRIQIGPSRSRLAHALSTLCSQGINFTWVALLPSGLIQESVYLKPRLLCPNGYLWIHFAVILLVGQNLFFIVFVVSPSSA